MSPRRLATFLRKEFIPLLDDAAKQLETYGSGADYSSILRRESSELSKILPFLPKRGHLQLALHDGAVDSLNNLRGTIEAATQILPSYYRQRFTAAYWKMA